MRLAVASERPLDLVAVVLWLGLTLLVVVLGLSGPLRVVLALPTVLFLPGYALVAALFPERPEEGPPPGEEGEPSTRQGLDGLERFALSLGLSIAVVPLLGLGLNFTPWGIRLAPVLAAITIFTLSAAAVAWRRRARLPRVERFQLAVAWEATPWSSLGPLDRALTVLLAVSFLAAVGTLAWVLANPRPGEAFTEFYILGPEGNASGYPTALSPGENGTMLVGVVNHEHEPTSYEVSVFRTRWSDDPGHVVDPNAARPPRGTEIVSYQVVLEDRANETRPLDFSLPQPGLWRVDLELRRAGAGDVEAYRALHLWVRVRG